MRPLSEAARVSPTPELAEAVVVGCGTEALELRVERGKLFCPHREATGTLSPCGPERLGVAERALELRFLARWRHPRNRNSCRPKLGMPLPHVRAREIASVRW